MAFEKLFQALIAIAVLFVVLGIFFIGPDALFGKARNATPNISKFIQIGSEEVKPAEQIPPKINKAYEDLVNAFKLGASAEVKTACLVYFDALDAKEDFDRGYYIEMDEAPDGSWFLLYNKDDVIVRKEKVPNVKPCFIAGKYNNIVPAKEFYKWLKGEAMSISPFAKVNSLIIKNNFDLYVGSKKYDLEDNDLKWIDKKIDLLLRWDNRYVCFIPTNDFFGANENGIKDNVLKEMLPGEKYNQFNPRGEPQIPFCSGENPMTILKNYLTTHVSKMNFIGDMNKLIQNPILKELFEDTINKDLTVKDILISSYNNKNYLELLKQITSKETTFLKNIVTVEMPNGREELISSGKCNEGVRLADYVPIDNKKITVKMTVCGG